VCFHSYKIVYILGKTVTIFSFQSQSFNRSKSEKLTGFAQEFPRAEADNSFWISNRIELSSLLATSVIFAQPLVQSAAR
jgi:hypothetical protein